MDRTWVVVEGVPPPLLDDPVLGCERLRGNKLRLAKLVAAAVRVVVGLGVGERLVRVQRRHDVLPAAAVAAEGVLGLLRDGHCNDVGAWTRQSKWGGLFERWRAIASVPIM